MTVPPENLLFRTFLRSSVLLAFLACLPDSFGQGALVPSLVRDIRPASTSADPAWLSVLGGVLYFSANDGSHGLELWRSDGTFAGTKLVEDNDSRPEQLTVAGGRLFFEGDGGGTISQFNIKGRELWKSDGSSRGTILVKDINGNTVDSFIEDLTDVNGMLYFTAVHPSYGRELWKSDGTTPGTMLVEDIRAGSTWSSPADLTRSGALLFFTANSGAGTQLWRSDGTAQGTYVLTAAGSSPSDLVDVNGTLFFTLDSDGDHFRDLWRSDGTYAATVPIAFDIISPFSDAQLTNCDGLLYFAGLDGVYNLTAMWRSNGTAEGTYRITTLNPNGDDRPRNFTPYAGRVYFTADVETWGGVELWRTDGTAAGTRIAANVNTQGATTPTQLTVTNGLLFFSGFTPSTGVELYSFDGTTALLVADLNQGPNSSSPESLTPAANTLYFTASDGVHGRELWLIKGAPSAVSLTISGPASVNELSETPFVAQARLTDGKTIAVTPRWEVNTGFASVRSDGVVESGEVNGTQVCVLTATLLVPGGEITASKMLRIVDGASRTTVSQPVISPRSAPFLYNIPVSIVCSTRGAEIHFTTDGSEPNEGSPVYSETFFVSETTRVHARAFKPSLTQSSVARAFYIKSAADDALAAARFLGTLFGSRVVTTDGVGWNDGEDYFYFDLSHADEVQISLSEMSGDANLDLLDAAGQLLKQSRFRGSQAEMIVLQLAAGRYFVRPHINGPVVPTSPDSTPPTLGAKRTIYTLALSNGPNWKILKQAGEAHHVGLLPQGGAGPETWVVIHGRQPAGEDSARSGVTRFSSLIEGLQVAEPGAQILALDWTTAAESRFASLAAAKWIPFVARDLESRLKSRGVHGDALNIVAHSWGSYVAAEALRFLGGQAAANRIVALDPALKGSLFGNFDGYSPAKVRFAANSRYSWAFYTSLLGSAQASATADESFVISWTGTASSGTHHSGAVDLFAALLGGSDPEREKLFHPDQMRPGAGPWRANQFSSLGLPHLALPGLASDADHPFEAVLKVHSSPVQLTDVDY